MNRNIIRTGFAFSLLLLLLACPAPAQEKELITLDLKTKLSEKLELTPAKNGAILLLMESEWGGVREYGEDYALWLRNVRHETHGDSVTVTLDVELRTSSLFGEGDLLKSRRIAVTYNLHDDWAKHGTETSVRLVRGLETCVEVGSAVAGYFYPMATALVRTAADGLEQLMPGELPQMKLEALKVGATVVAAAEEMVGEMR